MKKIISLILLIVAIFFSLLVGGFCGVYYQKQQDFPQLQKSENLVKDLSSSVVTAVVTYGTVYNIDGNQNIVLSSGTDKINIAIQPNAKFYSYKNSVKNDIKFSDIKVGDTVNITTKISSSGQFQGQQLVVF